MARESDEKEMGVRGIREKIVRSALLPVVAAEGGELCFFRVRVFLVCSVRNVI